MTPRPKFLLAFAGFFLLFLAGNARLAGKDNVSRSPGLESWAPRVAIDSVGNVHVAWGEEVPGRTNGDAYYAKLDISTNLWSTPVNLSNNGRVFTDEHHSVGLDVDSAGNVYVIYAEKNRVSMRIFSGGGWGSPILLHSWSSGDCDQPRVAVDSSGNIFTCWWIIQGVSVYSRARISGVWEDVRLISFGSAKFADIAVGNNAVFACWSGKAASTNYQINYVKRDKAFGSAWTAPLNMHTGGLKQQCPAIEIDGNDIPHIIYTPAFPDPGIRVVRHSFWSGNGFSAPVDISRVEVLHYPAADVSGGNIYAAWQTGGYGNGWGIKTNNRLNGAWTGSTSLPDSAGVTFCDVAVDALGVNVYYVWEAAGEIWCANGAAGAVPPDNDPPTAAFVFSPQSGIFPIDITFDASSSQDPDGSIVSYSWNFGDGGRASGQVVTHTYNRWGTFTASLAVRDNVGASAVKAQSIEIKRLYQPLSISWKTRVDESLFQTRRITEVTWSKNPENDGLGVQVVLYRVYRKKTGEGDTAYVFCGEVAGGVYKYLDCNVKEGDSWQYTVTSRDNQGHESPIVAGGSSAVLDRLRLSPETAKRGKLTDRY